jgi:hypothetical protein
MAGVPAVIAVAGVVTVDGMDCPRTAVQRHIVTGLMGRLTGPHSRRLAGMCRRVAGNRVLFVLVIAHRMRSSQSLAYRSI